MGSHSSICNTRSSRCRYFRFRRTVPYLITALESKFQGIRGAHGDSYHVSVLWDIKTSNSYKYNDVSENHSVSLSTAEPGPDGYALTYIWELTRSNSDQPAYPDWRFLWFSSGPLRSCRDHKPRLLSHYDRFPPSPFKFITQKQSCHPTLVSVDVSYWKRR
jgi:hypothetical protein